MSDIVPAANRELFAQKFNSARKELKVEKTDGIDVFLAVLNAYLFLAKEVEVDKDKYELIRKVLQEITEFFIIGDVESFEFPDPQPNTTKTLIKLG